MHQIRKRLTYANVMSSIAVFLVLGGAAFAATQLPKNSVGTKQLKNNAVNSAKVKNNSLQAVDFKVGQLPAGPKGDTGQPGPAGTALGYAHINPNGTFDTAHSKNVSAGNMTEPFTGFYCFKGLSFTPNSAVVTEDYNGVFNGQITDTGVQIPGEAGTCGPASQAMIFTGLVEGALTEGADFGFYVVFN
jgi:hypothetical protein